MKTRLILSVAASALMLGLVPAPAVAQTAAPAASTQGVQVPPLGFVERTLPNGLKVYTARDTNTSNVTVQVWYRVGAKDDPEGRSGFAHLFEHLMFKATRNLPPETFDRLTEDVGGSNNASTYHDLTNYYETVPAQFLERMLFAEADRMGSLVVNEAVMASERDVVKEEYRQRVLSTPYGRFQRLHALSFVYQNSPYRRPGIGSIEDLNAADLSDVQRFHETFYRPDNAFLIVAGNFDQAQLDAWIDQYFGPIERPDRPLPVNNLQETYGPARETTFYGPNVPLPMVQISYPTAPYAHPDRAALDILGAILSYGDSSRLYRSLVYEQQVAASAGASSYQQQQVGTLSVSAIMNADKTPDEGLAALRAEVDRIRSEPVTEAELAEARNELIADALRGRETIDDRAFAFGYSLIMTGDPTAVDRDIANLQAVTAADVQRVAQRYLRDDRAVTMRYLQADEQNPETPQRSDYTAPITLADLAPAGEPVTLAAEGERLPLPEPGRPVTVATPEVVEMRLDNGMRVLVAPTRGLPLVSARLGLRAGASDDAEGKAGTAAFTAGLLDKGTETRSAVQIASEGESLGADIGAGSGVDFTTVQVNAPSNVFPQALTLLSDMVRNPAFAPEELTRQQQQALNGLRLQLSQPGPVAGLVASRAVYGDAPYGRPAAGTPTSIPGLSREDLAAFHAARYRPENAVLTFSGDITPERARELAQAAFGDWRGEGPAPADSPDAAGPALPPRVIVIDQPGAGQAAVFTALRGVARSDEDYFALLVGNAVMGGGYSARLNQEIRIRRGLSYGAGSGLGAREDQGMLTAQAQTRNDAVPQVVDLMLTEVRRLSDEPVTEADMAPRKASLIGDYGRTLETVDGLGSLVANLALYDLPLSSLASYAADVTAVTPEAIQAAVREHIPVDRASVVVVGDARVFVEQLRAAHPNLEVVPMSELNLDRAALR